VSYVALNPSYYQMLQPEGAWHAGAPGWSEAPFPGWGENPALVGPKRLGVEGLGMDDSTKATVGMVAMGVVTLGLLVFVATRK
jgi:hypothetical protein